MEIWLWICSLLNSADCDEHSTSPPMTFELARSSTKYRSSTPRPRSINSIQLRAERSLGSNNESLVTFSVCVDTETTLWNSTPCHLSSDKPFLPLLLQLVQEIVDRSPTRYNHITSPRPRLGPEPILRLLEAHSAAADSLSGLFNIIFLTRLFWLCACDAPTEVGSLYFESAALAPGLDMLSRDNHVPVLRTFLLSVGVDVELCIAGAVGYVVTKWLILNETRVGLLCLARPPLSSPCDLGMNHTSTISYASSEAHGLWLLRGYAPVQSMKSTRRNGHVTRGFPYVDPAEAALRYALAHQQLEAVVQMEYAVVFFHDYIQVTALVDNLRLHVSQLRFNNNNDDDDVEYDEEVYFPSRVRVWVGPEAGSTYVHSVSVSSSTKNIERSTEMHREMKCRFGKSRTTPKIKAVMRMSTRNKIKNWRCDQDIEGNAVIYDATFCDNKTGVEVYTMRPAAFVGKSRAAVDDLFRERYTGADRPLLKSGGMIIGRDECRGEAKWRLSKEMEGSVVKWRIGGKVWVSYWPNKVESSYCDTRCVEWCEEVYLSLISETK